MTDETYPAATINFYFIFQGGTLHIGSLNLKREREKSFFRTQSYGSSSIYFPELHKTTNRYLLNAQSTVANNTHLIVGEQHGRRGKNFGLRGDSVLPQPAVSTVKPILTDT